MKKQRGEIAIALIVLLLITEGLYLVVSMHPKEGAHSPYHDMNMYKTEPVEEVGHE